VGSNWVPEQRRISSQDSRDQGRLDHEVERLLAKDVLADPGHFYDLAGDDHIVLRLLAQGPICRKGSLALT